ncbi:MAG: carboxypeptidase-like regulatory domain-containing protein [Bacteroidetes bacterium]|nr:carboxypeptidase-like regulatory domain-containing protein [Bacteroidota bacterium]
MLMNPGSRVAVVFLISFMPLTALGQNGSGVIRGSVYGPQGELVPYMPIQATEAESGEFGRTEASIEGTYEISSLAAGTYTLTIVTPCCAYLPYESEAVVIAAGETKKFEIHLAEGTSFNTVGDDPGVIGAAMRSRAVVPDLPTPRASDGKPDLSGLWLFDLDPFPEPIDALPWAEELFQERIANDLGDHPHVNCLPGEPPIAIGAAPFMAKFVQKTDLLIILFEDYPGFRQVFMDGREHPEDPNPSWMGHSIGHWDGDTLVIDTIGFNDRGWMAIYPRSEALHLVERYTRSDYGRMDLRMTVEDPAVFNKPWVANWPFRLAPQEELMEFVCENNKWAGTTEY